MRTHKQITKSKEYALKYVFNTIKNSNGTVKVNDLYSMVSNVWNSNQYFIQDLIKNIPSDIKISKSKKRGTFAVYTGDVLNTVGNVKRIVMNGIYPHKYEGRKTNISHDGFTIIKKGKYPKMFATLEKETIDLYKHVEVDVPTQYLQVTNDGNYYFTQVD